MVQFLHKRKTLNIIGAVLLLKIFLFASALDVQAQNNALYFNGNNSYVAANSVSDALGGTAEMSMEAWINRADNLTESKFILTFHQSAADNHTNILLFGTSSDGKVVLSYNNGSDNDYRGTTFIEKNKWTHIAVTISSDNTPKIYINGVLEPMTKYNDGTTPLSSIPVRPVNGGCFSIAQDWDEGTVTNDFIGQIDEVRIWNTVRTQDEIRENIYNELTGSETDLVAYYKMNEGSGTSLTDNSLNSNTGTFMGSPLWRTSGAFSGSRNALDFDGMDDCVSIPTSSNLNIIGDITLETWIKYDVPSLPSATYCRVICKGSTDNNEANNILYGLNIAAAGKLEFCYEYGAGQYKYIASDDVIPVGVWQHIAVVRNQSSKEVTFYVDGKQFGAVKTYTDEPTGGTTGKLTIGAFEGSSPANLFSGEMDEVRIWSKARTAAEIREDMMKTLAGTEAGLEAYYRFDEVDGTILYDIAGNDNNGTLTNMTGDEWTNSEAFNTWLGVESNDWNSAVNWSDEVPTSADNVGIYKTDLGNEANIGGSVNNLMISSTASPVLTSDLTVSGNLILEKNVDLNGQTVELGNAAYLIEDNGSFYGSSGTIFTTRDLASVSSENIGGLGAIVSTALSMGTTTITRGHAAQTYGTNNSITRYFDISSANNSGLNATLAFSYRDDELNGNAEAGLELFKSTDNGSTWQNQNGTVNTASNSVSLSGISSFSTWTLIEDTQSPTAEITYSSSGPYKSGDLVTITATFSEEMKDTPVPQIGISGSNTLTATNMVKSSSTVYTYEYTIQSGPGNCTVSLSTGTDLAGNVVQSTPSSGTAFTIVNQNPTFTSTPVTSVNDNESYEYTITADDGDGDGVSISGATVPSWLTLSDFVEVSTLGPTDLVSNNARACAADASGNVFVPIYDQHKIIKITPDGTVSTFAGNGNRGSVDGNGTEVEFDYPYGVAIDNIGNLYVSESYKIRKITPSGDVTTLAGSVQGYLDATGTAARFFYPRGIDVDNNGNVYVADEFNNRIRKVTPDGIVTTLAGSGESGYGNGGFADGTALEAKFDLPYDVAVDPSGNVYVADTDNNKIRKITLAGMVTTFASDFDKPYGIASDNLGNVYVADYGNRKIKKITPEGVVSVFAGSGSYSNIDGPAETASLKNPFGVTLSSNGNVYVANNVNIRKIESGTKLKGSAVGQAGEHPVLLKATDTNSGETSQNFIITVNDVTPPSGYSVDIDQNLIYSANEGAVSFTLVGAETGTTCNYIFSSSNGGTPVSGSSPVASASQKITGINLSGLQDGTITLTIKLKDTANNEGSSATDTSTKEATPPSGYSVSFDQSYINNFNKGAVSFTFSGAEIGSNYNYTITSSGGGTAVTGSGTIATATDQISGINLSGLGDGTLTLAVKLTDTAGNVGTEVTDTEVKDTVAPAVPSIPDLATGSDTGSSSTDNTTSDTTPTFSGTVEASATVTVISSVSGTLGTTTADGSGNWSFTSGVLTATTHNITVTATDAAGNTSSVSSALLINVDIVVPTISVNDGLTLNEGATATIAIDNLKADDADTDNSTLIFTITSSPSNGQLENIDNPGVAISSFTQQNLMDGKVLYVHDDSNTTSDSFVFKVSDGVPNELTGQTFAIAVTAIDDDAPTIVTNNGLELDEGATATIAIANLEADDADTDNSTLIFTITSSLSSGQLENIDNPGVAISSFTQQNLLDGKISYVHDDSNTTSDSFVFKVSDGVPNELTGQTFAIAVTAIDDDPPAVTTNTAADVAITTVTIGGNITSDNGLSIIERGVVYSITSINSNPEIGGIGVTKDDNGNETGGFSEIIGSLLPNTTYSFQAYATNSIGISYGGVESFTTYGLPVAICKNITIELDENGSASIEASSLDGGSTPEEMIETMGLSTYNFNCGDLGSNVVTLTITDKDGNSSQCEATVIVEDHVSPIVSPIGDIEVELEPGKCETVINYPEIRVNDNCSTTLELISGLGVMGAFPIGKTTEIWRASDSSGNSDIVSFKVIVAATNAPPIIDELEDIIIDGNISELVVPITGISGGEECREQDVKVSTAVGNDELFSSVVVNYTEGSAGELDLAIAPGVIGTSEITVTVEDSEGASIERTFNLTVEAVNIAPFLVNPLADQFVNASFVLKVPISSVPGELFVDSDNNSFTLGIMREGTDTLPSWAVYEGDTLYCTPMIADTGCVNIVVQATDPDGATATDTFRICVGGYPLNIGDIGAEVFEVQMYPNPTKGIVNLDINTTEIHDAELSVMDVTGSVVLKKQFSAAQTIWFDMSGKVSGIYFVHLNFGDKHAIRKLIIDRK